MAKPTISFGASVRGPQHAKEGVPNQDAWLRSEGRFGSLVVVCDGLGSKPQSGRGSRKACLAVREAVSRWQSTPLPPASYLAHLVEVFWRLRIHPVAPKDAATTCLLALACPDGTWVVGGVGDGLVAVMESGEDPVRIIGDRAGDWGNETAALGTSPGTRSWKLAVLPPTCGRRVAVLATDGVADDLLPEKLGGFCRWLVDDFGPLEPHLRWRRLVSELGDWPTPKHLDDKTVAVLAVEREQNGGRS